MTHPGILVRIQYVHYQNNRIYDNLSTGDKNMNIYNNTWSNVYCHQVFIYIWPKQAQG